MPYTLYPRPLPFTRYPIADTLYPKPRILCPIIYTLYMNPEP